MRQFKAVAVDLNSMRERLEVTAPYSGVKVAAVSPACSGDRHLVLVCVGVACPFMMTVSVSFHSPGAMPSAAAKVAPMQQAAVPNRVVQIGAAAARRAGDERGA